MQTPQAFSLPNPGHQARYNPGLEGVGLPRAGGLEVRTVAPGGPSAGLLQKGDVIREANGRTVRGLADFRGITDFAPTAELKLKVVRGGTVRDFTLTMKEN